MEKKLHINLKFLRKKKNLSLTTLASILKISKSAISDYENGKSRPSMVVVDKFAVFFDVNVDSLLNTTLNNETIHNQTYGAINQIKNIDFNEELMFQKITALEIQIQLLQNLVSSKESENATLRLQVKILMGE